MFVFMDGGKLHSFGARAKPDAVDNVKYDLQNFFRIFLTMNQKSI